MPLKREKAMNCSARPEFYNTEKDPVLASSESQNEFFYRLFPRQVEKGSRRPTTFDWIISRTQDGSSYAAPREVIHLLNCAITKQLGVLDLGGYEPDGENLVAGSAIKESLPEVSRTRLEQTLLAEFPELKTYIEKLKSEKTSQRLASLKKIWGTKNGETSRIANELVGIGFFELRGTKDNPEFWVPFLYRDALRMVQGSAE